MGGCRMPLYEYKCEDCKKTFSLVLSLKEHESGTVKCPDCGSKKVTQLIMPFYAKTESKT